MDIVKILKKNTSIIIPAAIALAALLLFIPTILIQSNIGKKFQDSIRLVGEVKSAINSAVGETQLEFAKSYEDKHQEDANEIQKLAIQTSQRPLISYKIFPEPKETSVQIFNEFKRTYATTIENLLKDMNALDAPTDAEIRKEIGDIRSESQTGSTTARGESSEKIAELIYKKRSRQIPVYAKPQVFSGYAFWDNWRYVGIESAVKDCWYCQLACWIHRDIVDTIRKINAGSDSVANSPVKRLLGIRFRSPDAGDIRTNGNELPAYLTAKGGGLCRPWTGRISNDQIDIIHFSLAVIIRADDILRFMSELCSEKTHTFSGYKNDQPQQQFKHNQITILQSSIEPVNTKDPDNKRYLYGQDAVAYLNLICEYLFYKEGYDIIEPNSVKSSAGQGPAQTPEMPSEIQNPEIGLPEIGTGEENR